MLITGQEAMNYTGVLRQFLIACIILYSEKRKNGYEIPLFSLLLCTVSHAGLEMIPLLLSAEVA